MSTKELKKRLKDMGRSQEGAHNVLVKRYELYRKEAGDPDVGEQVPAEDGAVAPHASDNPMMVRPTSAGTPFGPPSRITISVIGAGFCRGGSSW